MPSEYDIYRAYAGMNRSKSGFDTFMEGLKEIQAGARADRQLDIQERGQERQDQTLKFNQDQIIENRARQKETDKMNEMKMLLGIVDKPYQQSQILSKYGYSDLAKTKMDEYERGVDLGSVYNQSWEGSPIDQLGVLGEYLSNANPEDKFYQDAKSRRSDLLEEIKTTDEEILADIELGGQYQNAFNLLTSPASSASERQAGKDELIRLEEAFSKKTGESYKKATQRKSILPKEADDLDESNATSLLEGGTDDRLFKGYDDFDITEMSEDEWAQLGDKKAVQDKVEDKVTTVDKSKEPDTKVVSAGMGDAMANLKGDSKTLISSPKYDIDKVEKLSNKQRADLMSNILGKKVSSVEASRMASEIRLARLHGGLSEIYEKAKKRVGKGLKQAVKLSATPSF